MAVKRSFWYECDCPKCKRRCKTLAYDWVIALHTVTVPPKYRGTVDGKRLIEPPRIEMTELHFCSDHHFEIWHAQHKGEAVDVVKGVVDGQPKYKTSTAQHRLAKEKLLHGDLSHTK